ncbi:MAG TPA: hypothetical protein VNK96_00220 [Fimbriimonadales bacterium]|nr:hypothetical protein [Fimbriimonadales bacterium]
MKKAYSIAIFFIIGVGILFANQSGHLLRVNLKKGQVIRHEAVVKYDAGGQGMDVNMKMRVTQQCTAASNGVYTVNAKVDSVNLNSPSLKDPKMVKQLEDSIKKNGNATYKIDSLGRIISGTNTLNSSGIERITYPKNPIKIGQTWTSTAKVNSMSGTTDVKATLKLLGIERVGGVECYKTSVSTSTTVENMKISGNGFLWIRRSDGLEEKMNMSLTMKPMSKNANTQGIPSNVKMTMTMRRL